MGLRDAIVLLLRTTKRGAPDADKVVIRNAGVMTFVLRYLALRRGKPSDFFAPASYNTVARWIARGSLALGFSADTWRTHSMRRGAATTLYMQGATLHSVMESGRWLSERSARLYNMKAEIVLLRMKAAPLAAQWDRILTLGAIGPRVFDLVRFLTD